ncbi:hypothetical protein HOY80DRAFT_1053319 [Tuber brumale]|nr:hypothetical protein HOY80DRAFT_1053319 [Tuber brumale]
MQDRKGAGKGKGAVSGPSRPYSALVSKIKGILYSSPNRAPMSVPTRVRRREDPQRGKKPWGVEDMGGEWGEEAEEDGSNKDGNGRGFLGRNRILESPNLRLHKGSTVEVAQAPEEVSGTSGQDGTTRILLVWQAMMVVMTTSR